MTFPHQMTFFSSVQELRGECSRVTDMYSHRVSTVRSAGLKSHKWKSRAGSRRGTGEPSVLLVSGFVNSPLVGVIDGQMIRVGCC